MFLNKLNEVLEVKFAKAENNGNIPEPLKKKKKQRMLVKKGKKW